MGWNDFFSGTPAILSKKTERIYTGLSGSVHIIDSFFKSLYSSSSGGSVYYSSSTSSKLLIEESTFVSCKAASNGGSIYFGTSGEFALEKACGIECNTTGNLGQFSYSSITDSIESKNAVNDSSVSCSYSQSYYAPLYLEKGKIEVERSNFSSNICSQSAAMQCVPSSNGADLACSISYCTVAYNTGKTGSLIYLAASYFFKIDSCNIISNTHPSSGGVMILTNGKLEITGSCIINNSATYVIKNRNSNAVTLTNCTIDSFSKCSGSTNNINIPKTSFINKIKFLETALCFAKYDAVGSLTVVPDKTKYQPTKKRSSIEVVRAINFILIIAFVS